MPGTVYNLQTCHEMFKHAIVSDVSPLSSRELLILRIFKLKMSIFQAAFFLEPNQDCMVECLESCCSESSPPRFEKDYLPLFHFLPPPLPPLSLRSVWEFT